MCEMCDLASGKNRRTKVFFESPNLLVIRDVNLDGAKDRIMCLIKEHKKDISDSLKAGMIKKLLSTCNRLRGNWTVETTLRSNPQHFHIHARQNA